MSKGDALIDRGAERLEELSRKAAAKGGFAAKFADELAEDAQFLRKLKPSLITARARAQKNGSADAAQNEPAAASASEPTTAPRNEPAAAPSPPEPMVSTPPPETTIPPPAAAPEPAAEAPTIVATPTQPEAPSVPERAAPKPAEPPKQKRGGGPNPLVIVGVAFAAGILLAKVVDWRGHAHPKD